MGLWSLSRLFELTSALLRIWLLFGLSSTSLKSSFTSGVMFGIFVTVGETVSL
jgi:hypothetical protein